MANTKLNVLVYTGTGTTVDSVRHCLFTLRRLLSPNYAVIPVTESVLVKEPWMPTCSLLVIPGGADLGYCRVLNGEGNLRIDNYVRRGGRYLGFCAGGYYGSSRCEFEVGNRHMEVIGSRELGFYPGTCRGGAFKGFVYHSELGARAARVLVRAEAFAAGEAVPNTFHSYYNGGGVFADAEQFASSGVEVLATYADDIDVDDAGKAALVYCKVGAGAALLSGPHPEFAAENLQPHRELAGYEDLRQSLADDDELRIAFLKACLIKLGLEVSQEGLSVPSLSVLHLTSLHNAEVGELLQTCQDIITRDKGEELIRDGNDTFRILNPDSRWSMDELNNTLSTIAESTPAGLDYSTIQKQVIPHEEAWPEPRETPNFNHSVFYSSLKSFREKEKQKAEEWGNILLYGAVVTSTNTMLEKNPKLLSKLPTGFTFAATTQVAGRGRGSNVWVSPTGSLIMSMVINHPAHLAATRPVVFIQYLAAIAIVEAIRSYDEGYQDIPVKLKWPNDIYARDPTKPASPPSYVKIGGILSNINYSDGAYQLVLGIGINTTNSRPTTSLNALLPPGGQLEPFRIERLVARVTTRLEVLYGDFCRRGFSRDMEELYYAHWLHSGQVVTLEAEGGAPRAKVRGITRDWGMLRAEELDHEGRPTGREWALQSDENSFDFWKGLVRRKI